MSSTRDNAGTPLTVSFKGLNKNPSNHSAKSIEIMTGNYGSQSMRIPSMNRTITQQAKKNSLSLWKVMDSYKDGKIQWDEWAFVLGKLSNEKNGGTPVLKESESKFLFTFLDKTGNGEVTKTEFEGLFNDVCAKNEKMTDHIVLLQLGHKSAVEQQQRMGGIDWKIHQHLNAVDDKLTKILSNMETAKTFYQNLVDNCENPPPKAEPINKKETPYRAYYAGYRVFESPLHNYKAGIIQFDGTVKMAAENLQAKYRDVLARLEQSEKVVVEVNDLLQQFLESNNTIRELRARDEKCCKVFGMLCC